MKDRKNKKPRKIAIIFIVIVIVIGGGYFAASRGLPEMQELVINDVGLDEMPDGVYAGEFNRSR